MTEAPAHARQLFAGDFPEVETDEGRGALIAALLEDGDRDDLAWLAARIGREALAAWVERHGARRLSRRSRTLWTAVLALPPTPTPAAAEALWPLA